MTFKLLSKKRKEISSVLVKNSADGIFIFSKSRFEYVNPAFETLTGLSADEICSPGFDPLSLIHPDDRKPFLDKMEAALLNLPPSSLFEFRIVSKDGRVRHVEANTSSLSGDAIKILGNIREITARKVTEQSLRESEEKYRHLVESASDGIVIVQGSYFKYINPRAAEIGGFSPAELIDTPFSRFLTTEDSAAFEIGAGRKSEKRGSDVSEISIKHKKGHAVGVEINSGEITYNGKPADLIILRDISERRRTEEDLGSTLERLRKAMGATIQAMSLTIEIRDPYTAGHQKRVSDLARAIATEMKFSKEDIDAIRMAASIHDLGKISIPAEILSKPGKISEFEFRLIQNHPKIGFEILRTIEFPWPIADIVLQHHERMNGSGYPNGLTGDQILPIARVLAVADVVEAMVSHRPYRSALTLGEALHEISKNRSILYDPEAVDACKRLFIEGRFAFKN